MLLAGNEANYRATITREEAGDPELVLARLRQLIPMTDTAVEAVLAEIGKRSAITPVVVADRLSWEQFASIAVNAPALPGVTPNRACRAAIRAAAISPMCWAMSARSRTMTCRGSRTPTRC